MPNLSICSFIVLLFGFLAQKPAFGISLRLGSRLGGLTQPGGAYYLATYSIEGALGLDKDLFGISLQYGERPPYETSISTDKESFYTTTLYLLLYGDKSNIIIGSFGAGKIIGHIRSKDNAYESRSFSLKSIVSDLEYRRHINSYYLGFGQSLISGFESQSKEQIEAKVAWPYSMSFTSFGYYF